MASVTETPPAVPWWQVVAIGRNPRRTLLRIGLLVLLVYLARQFVVLPIRVDGISMLPTYTEKSVNFINRLAYVRAAPRRGDVVSIRMAGEHIMLMKRIVGLPGDIVAFRRGKLLLNGEPLSEPYVKLPCVWDMPPVEVGPNEYYVVGDNRSMAIGDHEKGRANIRKLVGKAML